jgi:Protein of unknown function (DUF2934)
MIESKLNELAENAETPVRKPSSAALAEDESARSVSPRRGLSVNETIAADANLSVGARGADTSGVRSGAGAGAGGASVTPAAAGESPAPNVVPGAHGSGTTPLSTGAYSSLATGSEERSAEVSKEEIASYAYRCWQERGCPEGSAEADWYRAERELRERRPAGKSSAAVA